MVRGILKPSRVTSWEAIPAETMIPSARGRYAIPVLIGDVAHHVL